MFYETIISLRLPFLILGFLRFPPQLLLVVTQLPHPLVGRPLQIQLLPTPSTFPVRSQVSATSFSACTSPSPGPSSPTEGVDSETTWRPPRTFSPQGKTNSHTVLPAPPRSPPCPEDLCEKWLSPRKQVHDPLRSHSSDTPSSPRRKRNNFSSLVLRCALP